MSGARRRAGVASPAASGPASAGEAEISSVLDGLSSPAIALGLDYTILAANAAYREAYGGGAAVVGRRCHEVSHASDVPCDLAGESCPLRACLDSGEPHRVLHVHHTPRGEEHVEVETRPVLGAGGEVRFAVETMRSSAVASATPAPDRLVGRSAAFNAMLELVHRVAPSRASVVLLGESGTGKELVAKAIHAASERSGSPFVPVECTGLTESLFESELIGHERGAFTGAHARRSGLVASARGGTLFLDEIGDIPPALQVKLLRLLETGAYRRVGSTEAEQADFRLICATHRPLDALVAEGAFRRDLYYRINAFPIEVPALRERAGDVALLAEAIIGGLAAGEPRRLSAAALRCLEDYAFPGNVRELRNILERALLLCDGATIGLQHLPPECRDAVAGRVPDLAAPGAVLTLDEVERRYLAVVAREHTGDRGLLARRLGISERTLYRKLRALDVDDQR